MKSENFVKICLAGESLSSRKFLPKQILLVPGRITRRILKSWKLADSLKFPNCKKAILAYDDFLVQNLNSKYAES